MSVEAVLPARAGFLGQAEFPAPIGSPEAAEPHVPAELIPAAALPGPIVAPESTSEEELKAVESATPVGRWGGEIEIASAVVFLLESGFVTGETLRVDGGRHVR